MKRGRAIATAGLYACAPFAILLGVSALAGHAVPVILAASCGVLIAKWVAPFYRPDRIRRFLLLDPGDPRPNDLMDALRQGVDEVVASRKSIELRIATPPRSARIVSMLDLTLEGDLELKGFPRRHRLQRRGVWIADHPLPLALPRDGSLTLLLASGGSSRVRVSLANPVPLSSATQIVLVLLAGLACWRDLPALLAGVLAFGTQYGVICRWHASDALSWQTLTDSFPRLVR